MSFLKKNSHPPNNIDLNFGEYTAKICRQKFNAHQSKNEMKLLFTVFDSQ